MRPFYDHDALTLYVGDCREVMADLPECSVDAIVTDPPYGLEFMNRSWDRFAGVGVDPAFGHWLAGFTDGEGCFHVHKKPHGTFDCQFSISLRADDLPVLERCHRVTGLGTIAVSSPNEGNPKARWTVSSKAHCAALRDIFRAFPLRAKKAREFEEWSIALDAWLTHQVGEWSSMEESRDRLMAMRAFEERGIRVDPFQMWAFSWGISALRVAKPGAHLLAFGSTRTFHRVVCGLEDAGWEVRDTLCWLHGQGFPKSLNLPGGLGTALKPAAEYICLARKPLRGTVAANVLAYGTGALNIDATRIGTDVVGWGGGAAGPDWREVTGGLGAGDARPVTGRWPANVLLDPEAARLLDAMSGELGLSVNSGVRSAETLLGDGGLGPQVLDGAYGDRGGASRFFYTAKTSRSEREFGLDDLEPHTPGELTDRKDGAVGTAHPRAGSGRATGVFDDDNYRKPGERKANHTAPGPRRNDHPTVKPVDLMAWLCRLVTPPGGLVLDPFLGSGSTGMAALDEGFRFIGIDLDAHYLEIARRRITRRHVIEPLPQSEEGQGMLL